MYSYVVFTVFKLATVQCVLTSKSTTYVCILPVATRLRIAMAT